MKFTRYVLSSFAVVALASAGSYFFINSSYADEADAQGQHHTWGFGRHCEKSPADIDKIGEKIRSKLDLDDTQNQQLDAVLSVVKSGVSKKQALHQQMGPLKSKSAPEKLEFLEKALLEGTNTLQQLQPVFKTFYNNLNTEQQTQLEKMLNRHRHGFMRAM